MLLLCWLLPAASSAAADDDAKERIVLVGDVLVDRDETAGDVVVLDGDVTVRGTVDGSVIVVDGDVTIRGTVTGDVVAVAGLATLGRRGNVEGDLNYGDREPVRTPARRSAATWRSSTSATRPPIGTIGFFIRFVMPMFLLGLVLILLAPRAAEAVAPNRAPEGARERQRRPARHRPDSRRTVAAFFTIVGLRSASYCIALIVPAPSDVLTRHDRARHPPAHPQKMPSYLAFLLRLIILKLTRSSRSPAG